MIFCDKDYVCEKFVHNAFHNDNHKVSETMAHADFVEIKKKYARKEFKKGK